VLWPSLILRFARICYRIISGGFASKQQKLELFASLMLRFAQHDAGRRCHAEQSEGSHFGRLDVATAGGCHAPAMTDLGLRPRTEVMRSLGRENLLLFFLLGLRSRLPPQRQHRLRPLLAPTWPGR